VQEGSIDRRQVEAPYPGLLNVQHPTGLLKQTLISTQNLRFEIRAGEDNGPRQRRPCGKQDPIVLTFWLLFLSRKKVREEKIIKSI
jgi:hypothetical protein